MRVTLAIDDDVFEAAKALAAQRHRSVGKIISGLARQALDGGRSNQSRNGFPLLAVPAAARVTLQVVNALRDELA